jgi:hypothetical protein
MAVCSRDDPPLVELSPGRSVACHLHKTVIPIRQEAIAA